MPPQSFSYPDLRQTPAATLTAETLGRVASHILSWQQGPGDFGLIHLHACWGESSALTRKYHGSSTWATTVFMEGVTTIARRRSCPWWKQLSDALAAQLLWQQAPEGGFIHASGEFEPTYTPEESCPIHQMMPALALLDYYEQLPKEATVRAVIKATLERHVTWFNRYWWRRGNGSQKPLRQAGWCGVTNQDLVAICALARYGELLGDWLPFTEYGIPSLDVYLGPDYFHPSTGLFERGDKSTPFTERCSYMCGIAEMLHRIHQVHPDPRIPHVLQSICKVLERAVYIDGEGNYQVANGAVDAETGSKGEITWQRDKLQISDYPEFLKTFARFADLSDDRTREKYEGLQRTLSSYVFQDGGIPSALEPANPLFSLVPSYGIAKFWSYLLLLHPDGVAFADIPKFPASHRRCGGLVFSSYPKHWEIHERGQQILRGIKQIPNGVLRATEELPNYPFPASGEVEYEEEVRYPADSIKALEAR